MELLNEKYIEQIAILKRLSRINSARLVFDAKYRAKVTPAAIDLNDRVKKHLKQRLQPLLN